MKGLWILGLGSRDGFFFDLPNFGVEAYIVQSFVMDPCGWLGILGGLVYNICMALSRLV